MNKPLCTAVLTVILGIYTLDSYGYEADSTYKSAKKIASIYDVGQDIQDIHDISDCLEEQDEQACQSIMEQGIGGAVSAASVPVAVSAASTLGMTASTGTAISALSGAAATSATLAAVGGPVVAVIGGPVAAVTGVVLGPAVVGGAIIMGGAHLVTKGIQSWLFGDD